MKTMNNPLIIYSYTTDRLKEFKDEKKENDIIITALNILEKEKTDFSNDNNIYIDITNLYKSTQDNPLSVEKVISEVNKNKNWHIIINYNSLTRFRSDFGQYIDDVIPINNIYKNDDESDADFSNLTNEQIEKLEKNLEEKLYGHKQFKNDLVRYIKNYSILYNLGEIKIMSLLICGDSGIGKTELARIIHETFYKDSKIIKINLGNYKTQGALNSLIGSPKGYYGSERGGELSNKIKNSDSKVILIDEFEKADNDIFNFFYELLEDGKFTDLNENEFDLRGYLIIFTTNLSENNYKKVIPEPLLSRFTMKALFQQLDYPTKNKYVRDKAEKLVNTYNEKYNKNINYHDVIKLIDENKIKTIKNFRYLNRLVQDALIAIIGEES
jgi:hypothetical protein